MILVRVLAAAASFTVSAIVPAIAADISGAGATFPYPIYAKWGETYKKETGIALRYQAIGSGDGIQQIQDKEVTFGTSEMPLKVEDLSAHGLVQFPTVVGGVVPVVNIEGVKSGDLALDGPTLARIFLGEIKSWNDAAIRKLNPKVKLPSQAIAVVHRSDGSGTTFAFTDYLSKVSVDWKSKVRHRRPHQGLDRLCRIRPCPAASAHLRQAGEPGRQGRCADHCSIHRCRRRRELGRDARLRRHPD